MFESLNVTELGFIGLLQSYLTSWALIFFKVITKLGDDEFFILVIPWIFHNFSHKRSYRILFAFVLSVFADILLKELFMRPRPFEIRPELGLILEKDYSFPSGHASIFLTFFCSWIFSTFKESISLSKTSLFGYLLVFLVGLSRIFLGVHYPSDILAGWLLGFVITSLCFCTEDSIFNFFKGKNNPVAKILLGIGMGIIVFLVPNRFLLSVYGLTLAFLLSTFVLASTPHKVGIPFALQWKKYLIACGGVLVLYGCAKVFGPRDLLGSSLVAYKVTLYFLLGSWGLTLSSISIHKYFKWS